MTQPSTTGEEPVEDDEVLLRRYADRDVHQDLLIDEGETAVAFLTSEAFQIPDDGCSVYRHRILTDHGIPTEEIRQPVYARLARVTASAVRSCAVLLDGAQVTPLAVVPSPWPDGRSGSRTDVSHADIIWAEHLPKKARTRARNALARLAQLEATPPPGDPINADEPLDSTSSE